MTVKITMQLPVRGMACTIEAYSVEDMVATVRSMQELTEQMPTDATAPAPGAAYATWTAAVASRAATAPAPAPAPAPEAPKAKKSVGTGKPAATMPLVAAPWEATTASSTPSPTPAPAPQAAPAAASQEPAKTYLQTGIPEAIAQYLGAKDSPGYADRRAAMVALLGQFKVAKGPELQPEQFVDFQLALAALTSQPNDPQ
jgi:hypothetical protein